jgi:hypothetical protein
MQVIVWNFFDHLRTSPIYGNHDDEPDHDDYSSLYPASIKPCPYVGSERHSADEIPGGYVVRDANGQALASVESDAALSRSATCTPFFTSFQPCRTALC